MTSSSYRGRRRRVLLAVATLCAALGAAVVTAAVAPTPAYSSPPVTTTVLPGNLFRDMVVDPASSQVFASLADTDTVAVLDFNGNVVSTITGEAGADGLVVHGGDLYVADQVTGIIDEFDTSTLQKVETVATGLVQPDYLVDTDGMLWTNSGSALAEVDPGTGTLTTWPGVSLGGLAADPADPSEIVTYTVGISPVTMGLIDLSSGTPTRTVTQLEGTAVPSGISNVGDVAVSPDGTHVVPAGGAPYEFVELDMSTMQPSGVIYPGYTYPSAVAMTSAGGGLFAGGVNGAYNPDVVVYGLDDPTDLIASYDFGTTTETTLGQGLAFSPDGSRLFVVTRGTGAADEFHVMTLSGGTSTTTTTTTTTTTPTTTTTTASGTTTTTTTTPSGGAPVMSASPSATLSFGDVRLGNVGGPSVVNVTNTGSSDEVVQQVALGGADPQDFLGSTDCSSPGGPVDLPPGSSCQIIVGFVPSEPGPRSATVQFGDNEAQPLTVTMTGVGTEGYYEAGADGHVYGFGDAQDHGDPSGHALAAPVVSIASTPDGNGYWLLGRDGGIFSYGDAAFYGSTGGMRLNRPVVGMASTPDGGGYWLVASDGGIFAYGDAQFYGSTGGMHLNQPIVGMAPTPDGGGYWLVASDGGIFAFGDAPFYGSTGAVHLAKPVVGMASTPDGGGYWLVASDGGIFAYGDARFFGSTGGVRLARPVVGMAPSPSGHGYWLVASDGGIFGYGDARFMGSTGGTGVDDIVSLSPTTSPTLQGMLGVSAQERSRAHTPGRYLPAGWSPLAP